MWVAEEQCFEAFVIGEAGMDRREGGKGAEGREKAEVLGLR